MTPEEIKRALAAPFAADQIGWKPQSVKGNRALAIAYIDARNVMDRLDEVVGVGGWETSYREIKDGVVCCLRVRIGSEWVTHEDVGSFSEQPDGGDRVKAAFSDALKRVGVHLGIGRYLYDLPHQWCDYDPQKRQFTATPRLPDWADPARAGGKPKPTPAKAEPPKPAVPATGAELHKRLLEADADLAAKGLAHAGALLAHVTQAGVRAGFGADLNTWAGPAIELAVTEVRAFKAKLGQPMLGQPKPAGRPTRQPGEEG